MAFEKLQSIINFAIEKEQEAADFYHDMAKKLKSDALATEMNKIAAMEEGHRDKLKKLNLKETAQKGPATEISNLKISDYLVEKEPTPDMSWQDILIVAMKREEAAMKLYTNLGKIFAADQNTNKLFQHLANEESSHKLYFEKIYDDEILREN